MSEREDDTLLELERQSQARAARVREVLYEAGRPDLVKDLDANLRDVRTGVSAARSAWHSISPAQRRVLELLEHGRVLVRPPHSMTRYNAIGEPHALGNVCSLATARALCAHELLACDGTTFDPELRFVLTERGRFVLAKGRPALGAPD